jgi:hypothetical protein
MGLLSKRSTIMKKVHNIEKIQFSGKEMILLVDGNKYIFQLNKISKKLAGASQVEKEKFKISPSGYGIHWPLIDEDLSIDGLLGIRHEPMPVN